MRGKHKDTGEDVYFERITPACAGKTVIHAEDSSQWRDHPRVCGENCCAIVTMWTSKGSPPRVRGKPLTTSADRAGFRITPACAGKTLGWRYPPRGTEDHPRVCGENGIRRAMDECVEGSPPRVRGKLCRQNFHLFRVGVTPACAGKTRSRRRAAFSIRDHPRVCGENIAGSLDEAHTEGSPPRVRGKPIWVFHGFLPLRITPACAGKTVQSFSCKEFSQDHPRVCGENSW